MALPLDNAAHTPPSDSKPARTNEPPRRRNPEKLLLRISAAVASRLDLTSILDTILREAMDATTAQEGSILLHNPGRERLEMLASSGLPKEIASRGYIHRKGSVAEWVIENNRPILLNGAIKDHRFTPGPAQRQITSAMCLPLRADGGVIGVLNLNRIGASAGVFRQGDLKLMTLVAAHAADGIRIAQLNHSVLQSEKLAAIGETISGVAHCIKNLLSGLSGGLFICNRAVSDRDFESYHHGSVILEKTVTRVSALAMDMLEYSSTREPVLSDIPIRKLFNELISLESEKTREKQIEIEILEDGQSEVSTVRGESSQIFRCLLNLVDNAIHYSPSGGQITLSASVDASPAALQRLRCKAEYAVVLRVADSGPGVPEDIANSIFEPFFSTRGGHGTGLGLAVTRKIVHEHMGEIELETREPGQGAVFAIYLSGQQTGKPVARPGND